MLNFLLIKEFIKYIIYIIPPPPPPPKKKKKSSTTVFNINNKKCLLSIKSAGSCDPEDWSNDADEKFSFANTEINYIKYTENNLN